MIAVIVNSLEQCTQCVKAIFIKTDFIILLYQTSVHETPDANQYWVIKDCVSVSFPFGWRSSEEKSSISLFSLDREIQR
jgi:hypothetical protein